MGIVRDILNSFTEDAEVKDIRQGPFRTAVWARYCGLSSTPTEIVHCDDVAPVAEAGKLIKKSAIELAQLSLSKNPYEISIGMATVNALVNIEAKWCQEVNARDILIGKGRDKNVAVIGHFPFVPKLAQVTKKLWVMEMNPQDGDLPADEAKNILPQAEVIGITGSAFINGTIDFLLSLCNPEAYIVVLGGTTPLSSILFDYGVDAVSGAAVVDPESVLSYVSQGATFRQLRGVKLLTLLKNRAVLDSIKHGKFHISACQR